MPEAFLIASIVGLLFTVNAARPPRWALTALPVFFSHWLTTELAPLLLALHVGGITFFVAGGGVDGWAGVAALALSSAVGAGLAWLTLRSMRSHEILSGALREGLGPDAVSGRPDMRWRQLVHPFWMRERGVRRVRNLSYGPAGRRNSLDVYRHADTPPGAGVLIQIHGGGWTVGNKDQQGKPLMLHMAARGWVCVAINYRLSPRATWPAHIVDVKRAIAWVRANIAGYGGDPGFIALTGGSAGGHLTALAALTADDPTWQPGFEDADTSVQAAVPFYGVYDWTGSLGTRSARGLVRFLERTVVRRSVRTHLPVFEAASPIRRVHAGAPPFFVIHGAHDTLAPVEGARAFVRRLREVSGSPVCYAELPWTQHAFDVFRSVSAFHAVWAVERFCERVAGSAGLSPRTAPGPVARGSV